MAEWGARVKVGGNTATAGVIPLNSVVHEHDINNKAFGLQSFVWKSILDATINVSVGTVVGSTLAAGMGICTPDISDTTAAMAIGMMGGLATVAVTAGTTDYQWVQFKGLNRYDARATTGTVTAGLFQLWSDDDVIGDIGATTEEHAFGCAAVTKDSDNLIQNGNFYLLG